MRVAVLMGSEKDLATMQGAIDVLDAFGIDQVTHVMSAHRTPERVSDFSRRAVDAGFGVIICGAGKAAHLAGAVAAHTTIPVVGVPIATGAFGGLDALLSTVQMPTGVPVATVAVDGAANAGYLAVGILSLGDPSLAAKLTSYREGLRT